MITISGIGKWILPVYKKYMLDYKTRTNVFYGGAGSGKSYFVVQKTIIKALRSKRKVLVVRKVGRTIKNSIWDLFLELLTPMRSAVVNVNKSDFAITLINGSKILFTGLDDSEKIKSVNGITDIVIEEATELTKDDFTQLNLRLRAKTPNNQIHLMFNPVSKANWVYKYFFEDGTPKDCMICHTNYEDNPHLPKEYVESLKDMERRNPAYYKIYALGDFATLDKLVFPVFTKKIISEEEKQGAEFWCGLDFGYTNDPTAITWGFYNSEKRVLMITGEYNKRGMTNDEIAKVIESLGLAKERIVADSAEPKSIAELKRLGIRRIRSAVKGKDSVINGIDKMQRCDIIIDERCTNTCEEFENYTWIKDKGTGEYINEPIDSFNHHIDSIRYGIQLVITGKQKSTYKSVLR